MAELEMGTSSSDVPVLQLVTVTEFVNPCEWEVTKGVHMGLYEAVNSVVPPHPVSISHPFGQLTSSLAPAETMDGKDLAPVTVLKTVSLNVQDQQSNQVCPTDSNKGKDEDQEVDDDESKSYPFAAVLRIRVLQIVCGISSMVMGTVGFIEEKGEVNLGLSIPAGAVTVIAAGASIHTSRGFGGYKPSNCAPRSFLSQFRFLGPSVSVAAPLTIAWATAFILHATLCVLACKTLAKEQWITVYHHKFNDYDVKKGLSESVDEEWNTRALAAIILILSVITVLSTMTLLRIDCLYDPD